MKNRLLAPLLPLVFLLTALASAPAAQIRAFTLPELLEASDGVVHGEIVAREVFRRDDPVDGLERYFTRLTVAGRSLVDGRALTIDVVFHGGFLDTDHGVFNSAAPAAEDVRPGQRVVAFYRWTSDMGAGVAANVLMAAKGGLYRTVEGPRGPAVLGHGRGFAIARNQSLASLESAVHALRVRDEVVR